MGHRRCFALLFFLFTLTKISRCTLWDGITPWYTGSKCNCNGYSNRCYFDQKLYEKTGHGGHCLDCTANRDGVNCERCRDNFYMRQDGYCIPCDCNRIGSRNLQCNDEGICSCMPGVTGEKCDRCEINFYDFSAYGCKNCSCSQVGSIDNQPRCNPYSGTCYCKENVEGKRCRECKPGFFDLQLENPFGCTPCFCYGHSSSCKSTPGYSKYTIESTFARSDEKWTAEDINGRSSPLKYDSFTQSIGVRCLEDEIIYFAAPYRFLGDQRSSYNQLLEFILKIGNNRPTPSATDVIIEGNGLSISNTIFSQQNKLPSIQAQKFSFRLNEHPNYGWQPRVSSFVFISIITNITAIKIKGTYGFGGVGYMEKFRLESALRGGAGEPAHWIETCDCPTGYTGQFCESCAPGYRHSPARNDPFLPCVPCDCNNHASLCDSETGKCICQHNTTGENCQYCNRGYYGNALKGTPNDCQPCGCPNNGPCIQIDDKHIMCTECPTGYTGHRCEFCSDGYFGDPSGQFGPIAPCKICDCNKNIDPNAIGNCNTTTGECLKCIYNTGGAKCDVCLSGFYGNALVQPKGDCKRCECDLPGTETDLRGAAICDQTTGTCQCKNHVIGRNCDKCEDGYFNLLSGHGCQNCNCDTIGSINQTCDGTTGKCYCRAGITGLRCDRCENKHYGFSIEGCKACDCDPLGSVDLQCDNFGQCLCLDNVEGKKCDRCKENKYDRRRGCIECPECYKLVQRSLKNHTDKLDMLNQVLYDIETKPTVVSDDEFPQKLMEKQKEVAELYENSSNMLSEEGLFVKVDKIRSGTTNIWRTLSEIDENLYNIENTNFLTKNNLNHIDELVEEFKEKIDEVEEDLLVKGTRSLKEAQERAIIAGEHSEKMTAISQDARDLANNLQLQALNIEETALKSKLRSIEAYKTAKNSLATQGQITDLLRYLRNELQKTEQQLYASKEWTKEVSDKAQTVKKNALLLFNEIENLIIPKIDIDEFVEKSRELKQKALDFKSRYNNILKESEDVKNRIAQQIIASKELLAVALKQQEEIDDLKNDLILYESQEKFIINLWNEIWSNANSNYKLLKEFDSQTRKSKEEADSALETVNKIEITVKATLLQIQNYQDNVQQAIKNANLASQKAQQANQLANNASIIAEGVKRESELLFKNSTLLSEEAALMFDRVQNTEGELKNLIEKTRSNTSLINEAKEKVGRAGKDTQEVSDKVKNLLTDIESIMSELQNSPGIDDNDVDRLEEQIRITEEKIRAANLDETLEQLKEERKAKDELIENYKKKISMLEYEVENIERVVEALPTGCYRRVELEP